MFRNIKLGKRILIACFIIALLSSIGGFVGIFTLQALNAKYDTVLTDYGFAQGKIGLFTAEFNASRVTLKDIASNNGNLQDNIDLLDASNQKLNIYLADIEANLNSTQEKTDYQTIKKDFSNVITVEESIIQQTKQNNSTQASSILSSEAKPLSDQIRSIADSLMSAKASEGQKLEKSLQQESKMADFAILCILIFSLCASIVFAVAIARNISKPIAELDKAAQKMAEGDLSVEINIRSKDEIGQLGTAFSKTASTISTYIRDIKANLAEMEKGNLTIQSSQEYKGDFIELKNSIHGIIVSFNDVLVQINQVAEQVASGSAQLSNSAQALASGATEQASSVEELSASISQISEKSRQNAENVNMGMTYVQQAGDGVGRSNEQMQRMLAAMTEISDASNKISKIIKVIDDIAFQTNILALNAAVEAARAGEAGKGFAVVADEVRSLASKSADAAKQTTALIESSIASVQEGVKIAGETAESLEEVEEKAKLVTDAISKIDDAIHEQAMAASQITQGMDQISTVIQTNSASAEESAAASEELSAHAQTLRTLTEKFTFR